MTYVSAITLKEGNSIHASEVPKRVFA